MPKNNSVSADIINEMLATASSLSLAQPKVNASQRDQIFPLQVADEDKKKWSTLNAQSITEAIHIVLPGYATGDRYTLGMLMVLNEKVKIHIVFDKNSSAERRNSEEAFALYEKILKTQNRRIEDHVGLNALASSDIDSDWLANNPKPYDTALGNPSYGACMIWNTCLALRERVFHEKGAPFPLHDEHLFHVSISTTLMAICFEKKPSKSISILQDVFLNKIIPDKRKKQLTKIYEENFIDITDSVILWVNNRCEKPDLRVAEIFSRPVVFEQIIKKFNGLNIGCVYAGDEWGKRHPHCQANTNLQAFWAKFHITTREDQWYFMAKIMMKNRAIIGNRSGALEPFALLGMPVIYLEHTNIFTSERLAQLIHRVPTWNRVVSTNPTGYGQYINPQGSIKPHVARTEYRFIESRTALLMSLNVKDRQEKKTYEGEPRHRDLMRLQEDTDLTYNTIYQPGLTSTDLDLIVAIEDTYHHSAQPHLIHINSRSDIRHAKHENFHIQDWPLANGAREKNRHSFFYTPTVNKRKPQLSIGPGMMLSIRKTSLTC